MDDMSVLGYQLEDVGVQPLPLAIPQIASPLMAIFVKEKDLATPTTQLTISAGMFRALALVIFLNDCIFRKLKCTLLIDDIGEGLDFSRSRDLVHLLIDRAKKNDFQLIMTTNDRFVMNEVPLEYWGVINRSGSNAKVINKQNAPAVFAQFEELGLSNFDFFSTGFFENGLTMQ